MNYLQFTFFAGSEPGCEEGVAAAVQVPRQVLPGGRGRGAHPGHHAQALLPSGNQNSIFLLIFLKAFYLMIFVTPHSSTEAAPFVLSALAQRRDPRVKC